QGKWRKPGRQGPLASWKSRRVAYGEAECILRNDILLGSMVEGWAACSMFWYQCIVCNCSRRADPFSGEQGGPMSAVQPAWRNSAAFSAFWVRIVPPSHCVVQTGRAVLVTEAFAPPADGTMLQNRPGANSRRRGRERASARTALGVFLTCGVGNSGSGEQRLSMRRESQLLW
ncbi:hypothetical protein H4S06_004166, partial [Coemansia sp. BCRC 34490]